MADRETILDYEGEVRYENNYDLFWLEDGINGIWPSECELGDAVEEVLGIGGMDWRGRLHILVELVEEGE